MAVLLAAAITAQAPAHPAPIPRSGHCNPLPTTGRDLILWTRWPRVPDFATEIGDADLVHASPPSTRHLERLGTNWSGLLHQNRMGFRQPRL
jgi:hypothetical protein